MGAPQPEGTCGSIAGCVRGLLAHCGLFFVVMRLSGTMTLDAGCMEEFCSARQRVDTHSGEDEGQGEQ